MNDKELEMPTYDSYGFQGLYRSVDMLLLDNIQLVATNLDALDDLFHIGNAGLEAQKQQKTFFDGPDHQQHLDIRLARGTHLLAVLCCALGLRKEDWAVGKRRDRRGVT